MSNKKPWQTIVAALPLLLLLQLPAGAASDSAVRVVEVDCDKGDRIATALEKSGAELIVEIRGICDENVLIQRERVTLIGSDPAVDGIRGVGPADLPGDAVVRVQGSRLVRLENLAILDGAARGVQARGSRVELVNCRIEGHARDGLQFVDDSLFIITDTVISDIGRIALAGFNGDLAVCTRCTISDSLFGVAAVNGSRVSVTDSAIEADVVGVDSEMGGSSVGLVNTSVSGGFLAVSALEIAEISMTGGSVSGIVEASDGGRIRMSGTSQVSNPSGFNHFGVGSFGQLEDSSSLLGDVLVEDFSRLVLRSDSSITGNLTCASGGEAFCSDPSRVSGSSTCELCRICTDDDGDGFAVEGGSCGDIDCDDGDADSFPGAFDFCDGADNDCDGNIDENNVCCTDADGDGFAGEGGSCGDLDCDDTDANSHPGAFEFCDGKDNDCDGDADEDGVCVGCTDADGDGAYVEGGACGPVDCDDGDVTFSPYAPDTPCNGVDENCDGSDAGAVFAGACYVAVTLGLPFFDAEQACIDDFGGQLASIHSDAENDHVTSVIEAAVGPGQSAWVGGHDTAVEGTFVWTDGTPFDYENWIPGEPNNSGNEDCLHTPHTDPFFTGWNDTPCHDARIYVCKLQ